MLKRLLALDGVQVVARFRDNGELAEGYGLMGEEVLHGLARFAAGYNRLSQGNADQLSMFTNLSVWTPPRGWMVRSAGMTVCCFGNVVCIADNRETQLNEVMEQIEELPRD
jgi:roadblock/LC7 domain-containing protein